MAAKRKKGYKQKLVAWIRDCITSWDYDNNVASVCLDSLVKRGILGKERKMAGFKTDYPTKNPGKSIESKLWITTVFPNLKIALAKLRKLLCVRSRVSHDRGKSAAPPQSGLRSSPGARNTGSFPKQRLAMKRWFLREENRRTWRITRGARREPETNSSHIWHPAGRNQTRRTLVGTERSRPCAIPSPQMINYWSIWLQNSDLILLCFRTQENPVLWDKEDCSWRSEARFLHENAADNSQSCR